MTITSKTALLIKPFNSLQPQPGSQQAHLALGLDKRDLENLTTPTDLFPVRAEMDRGRTID